MRTLAVVLEEPKHLALSAVELVPPSETDVVVDVLWSGISTGTEKLLWSGDMPAFPGLSYPLVPGYESVGRVRAAPASSDLSVGDLVFVPGSRAFVGIAGLFGGAARHLVTDASRLIRLPEELAADGALLALAATARHALRVGGLPSLIVGHGVLGRLLARLVLALGDAAPTVWETQVARRDGAMGYPVVDPAQDAGAGHHAIMDASGDSRLLDTLMPRLAKGGTITLAGFYSAPLSFAFPIAFMREATIRIAAEFEPQDVRDVLALVSSGALSLGGLVTHRMPAQAAADAYAQAFTDPACLKMVLDWSACP